MNVYIEPATSIIYSKPGTSTKIEYTVRNDGDPSSFLISSITNTPFVTITLGENKETTHSVFLPTGRMEKGFATISIQDSAPEKDYYPQLVFGSGSGRIIEGKTTIGTSQRVLSNILLTVTSTGRLDTNVSIEKFSIGNQTGVVLYDSIDTIDGDILVRNSGANWTYVTGTIRVVSPIGTVDVVQIPKQRILGHSSKLVYTDRSANSAHSFQLDGIHIGNYKALVSIESTDKAGRYSNTKSFTAVPFKLLGILLIVIVITTLFLHKLNRGQIEEEVLPVKL